MLYYLIYCSTAMNLMSDEDLRFLLRQARSRNRELVITGMLVYVEGRDGLHARARFMQVLEGSRFLVESVFDKIQRDNRHHEIVVLKRQAISKRNFKTWDMGFERLNLKQHPELEPFFAIADQADEPRVAQAALDFLKCFYDQRQDLN